MNMKAKKTPFLRGLVWIGLFAALSFAVLALCTQQAEAYVIDSGNCGAQGDNVKWSLDSDGVLTISGKGAMADYRDFWVSNFNEYSPWTKASWSGSLGGLEIEGNRFIHTVVIENGVTTIGNAAFCHCTYLESVTIPNSVTSIGDFAFGYQPMWGDDYANFKLKSVTIPNSVTTIGTCAFRGCVGLTSITIPANVKKIDLFAFGNCQSLTTIKVDSANQYYASDVYGCLYNKEKTELLQYPIGNARTTFTIPNGITTIGSDAFNFCKKLTKITIPDSVKTIVGEAFTDCVNLNSITIPASVESLGGSAFSYCDNLKSVEILNPKCSIGIDVFPTTVVIHGYKNSTAQAYAQDNSLTFIEIIHTHVYGSVIVERQATCSQTGLQYQACTLCGERINETTIPKTAHTYKKVKTAATVTQDGSICNQCTVCGKKGKSVTIAKVSTLKLSKTSYVYTGKARTPSLIIQDANGKTLKKNTDYKIAYAKGRTECGTYKVVVKLMGNYAGKKTLKFNIKLGKVTGITQQNSKGIYLTWNEVTGASRYEVWVYKEGYDKPKCMKSSTDTWIKKSNLTSGQVVKMQIRAVRVKADGTETYSAVMYTATAK